MDDPGQHHQRLRTALRGRVRELGAFGAVGAACVVVDMAVFHVLYAQAGAGAVSAKLGAAAVSTTAAFLGHRFATFAARARTGLRREYARFALVNAGTLLLSLGIVAVVRYPLAQEGALVLQAANVLAIGTGTVVRYLVYRRWVFLPLDAPEVLAALPVPGPGVGTAPAR